jgi:hypothetical protein
LLKDIDIGNVFLNSTPIAQEIRTRIDKWYCIKLESFCTAKRTITRIKRQPTEWEIIFASYSQRIKIQNIQKAPKIKYQKTNNPINKWANELNRQLSKKVQMINK